VGKQVRQFRKDCGMTQEDLADAISLSTSFVGMIERGENIPSVYTLLKICNVLNVKLSVLFDGNENVTAGTGLSTFGVKDPLTKRITSIINKLNCSDKRLILEVLKRMNKN
jgi:transcriptional regulator with XRE-family HTH domain